MPAATAALACTVAVAVVLPLATLAGLTVAVIPAGGAVKREVDGSGEGALPRERHRRVAAGAAGGQRKGVVPKVSEHTCRRPAGHGDRNRGSGIGNTSAGPAHDEWIGAIHRAGRGRHAQGRGIAPADVMGFMVAVTSAGAPVTVKPTAPAKGAVRVMAMADVTAAAPAAAESVAGLGGQGDRPGSGGRHRRSALRWPS